MGQRGQGYGPAHCRPSAGQRGSQPGRGQSPCQPSAPNFQSLTIHQLPLLCSAHSSSRVKAAGPVLGSGTGWVEVVTTWRYRYPKNAATNSEGCLHLTCNSETASDAACMPSVRERAVRSTATPRERGGYRACSGLGAGSVPTQTALLKTLSLFL